MAAGFKHVGFLTRRADQTPQQFLDHWHGVHSELARRVPGVRGYVINPVDRSLYPDSPVDGFSEVWFDSLEAAEAAWNSPEGVATFADVDNFIGHLAVANVREVEIVAPADPAITSTATLSNGHTEAAPMDRSIRHTVAFALHHAPSTAEEADFLTAARQLATIPGVQNFTQLRQVSPKNDFSFLFEMTFADEAAYQAYNAHPRHKAFVATRWQTEVSAFLEIDLTALDPA